MSYKVSGQVTDEHKHREDVECCVFTNGRLYTGSDDGVIKCWSADLQLEQEWQAHQYVVYDMAADHESGHLYSCSMDGEIKLWSVLSPASPPTCLRTALQTGPTGAGADLGGGGLAASLEHELVTVRKLVFSSPWLYAGDEMGGLCQWTADLSDCRLKKEYYTEIWSLALTDGGRTVLTARDNEIIAAELTGSSTVLVSFTLPGRAPVVMDNTENIMVCPNRGGMDIIVRRRQDNRYVESQVLRRHDMIINSLLVRGDTLLSAGWDARVAVWRQEGDQYNHVEDVKLQSYVNTMCPGEGESYYVGGKKGYLVKLAK